nr:glycosyltransferase [Propionibacterium freudenreichii]
MVSVCMASFNGAEFIAEQITSVLDQLAAGDELIIIDDASTDNTVDIITHIEDPRIRLLARDTNWGYVRTFEQALGLARGEYLFLCDQDDVWIPGRVNLMVAALADHQVIASNLASLGGPNRIPGPFWIRDWRLWSRDSTHSVRNLIRLLAGMQCYWGCAMAVRRDALCYLLPFPEFLYESHDLWIGLCGNMAHSMGHVNGRTVWRRVHGSNLTPLQPRGIIPALRSRLLLIHCMVIAWRRGLHIGRMHLNSVAVKKSEENSTM